MLRIDEKFEDKKKELNAELGDAQLSLFTYEKAVEIDLFANNFYEKLSEAIQKYAVDEVKKYFAEVAYEGMMYLKIMTDRYDVVASNPPYTDSSAYSGTELALFLENNYKKPMKFIGNLYASFYKRNYSFLLDNGFLAMIHPMTFMYIPKETNDIINIGEQENNVQVYKLITTCLSAHNEDTEMSFYLPSGIARKITGITYGDGYEYVNENNEVIYKFSDVGENWKNQQVCLQVNTSILESALKENSYTGIFGQVSFLYAQMGTKTGRDRFFVYR